MKILRIIYDWADPKVITEGLSTGPYELTLAQAKLGHEIFVLCGNLNGKNLISRKFSYTLADGKVRVYNLPRALTSWTGPFFSTSIFVLPFYFYLKLFRGIDLIHNHQQMGVWLLCYKYIFKFIDKTPLVHTNHGSIKGRVKALMKAKAEIPLMSRLVEFPIHKFSDYLSLKTADAVVAVSSNLKNELEELYGKDKEINVVENGVNLDKFKKSGDKLDLQFGNNSVVIGNIGRLSERKNIHVIIDALRYLPSKFKLLLAGEWDENYKKTKISVLMEEKDIDGNSLKSRIQYVGIKPYWEVDKLFRSINIFVLPSSHEGLPKVILEALSTGSKVIASGFKLDKMIPNLYLIDTPASELLAQKILEVEKENDYYILANEILEKSYSWDSKSIELQVIYEKLLKKNDKSLE